MNRFFVNKNLIANGTLYIVGEDLHHMVKVLRLKRGDPVELCDGLGMEYKAIIEGVTSESALLRITHSEESAAEPTYRVTLFQCLPKQDKMELIIQKCVELGVYEIVPVLSRRCIARFKDESSESKRIARYNRIAYEAAKQSKRGVVPRVSECVSLTGCDISKFDLSVVAYEEEREVTLKGVLSKNQDAGSIAVFIGPEGGFEWDEIQLLKGMGAVTVTLGNRILRTETAGMAALSMIEYHFSS